MVGKLGRHHEISLFATRHPLLSGRERLFKKRTRMVETLRELSAAMGT
jgi:hypothetical protein